jgi:hypothetical protein
VSYTAADGRRQLLDQLATATDRLGQALAQLGEAYEHVDEHAGDELEARLFRPVQGAFGLAQRTHGAFAERHGLPARGFSQPSPGLPADPRVTIERAIAAIQDADQTIATLQDSMLPVEVGDPELRAGLARVREQLDGLPAAARNLLRSLGR